MDANKTKGSGEKRNSSKSLGAQLKEKRDRSARGTSKVEGSGENVKGDADKSTGRSGGKKKAVEESTGKEKKGNGVGNKRAGKQDAGAGAMGSLGNKGRVLNRKVEFKRYTTKLYNRRRDRLFGRLYKFSKKWKVSVAMLMGVRGSTDVLVGGLGIFIGNIRENHPHYMLYKPPYRDTTYKLTMKVVQKVQLSESIKPVEVKKKKVSKKKTSEKEPCEDETVKEKEVEVEEEEEKEEDGDGDNGVNGDNDVDVEVEDEDSLLNKDNREEEYTPPSPANETSATVDEQDSSWNIQSLDIFFRSDLNWNDEKKLLGVLRGLILFIQSKAPIDFDERDQINCTLEILITKDQNRIFPSVLEALRNFISIYKERSCNVKKILPDLLTRVNSGVSSEIKKLIIANLELIKSTFNKSHQFNAVLSLLIDHPYHLDHPTYVKIPCLEYVRGLLKASEDLVVDEKLEKSFIQIINYLDDEDEKLKKNASETIWRMFNSSSKKVKEALLKLPEPYKAKMLETVGLSRWTVGLKGDQPASVAGPSSRGELSGINGLPNRKSRLSKPRKNKNNSDSSKLPPPKTVQHKIDVKKLSNNIL